MVFRRGKTWYARYKDHNDAWRSEATDCLTKDEAREYEADLRMRARRQRQGLEPTTRNPKGWTFLQLCDWYEKKVVPTHAHPQKTKSLLKKHLRSSELASLQLQDVTPAALKQFVLNKLADTWVTPGGNGKPPQERRYSPRSVKALVVAIGAIFGHAMGAGLWLGENPASEAKRLTKRQLKDPSRVRPTLTIDQIPRLLPHVRLRQRPLFAAAIYAGLRKGELMGMHKLDVNLDERTMLVKRSHGRDIPKGGVEVELPIHPALVPYLEDQLQRHPESPYLFPGIGGARRNPDDDLARDLRAALARAGINKPRMRFHDLRHTFLTLLAEADVDARTLQELGRHSDIRTTLVYVHQRESRKREAIERLRGASDALAEASELADNVVPFPKKGA